MSVKFFSLPKLKDFACDDPWNNYRLFVGFIQFTATCERGLDDFAPSSPYSFMQPTNDAISISCHCRSAACGNLSTGYAGTCW